MRTKFDEGLELLNRELTDMGGLCERAIAMASKALTQGDTALARDVTGIAEQIDRKEREVEALCLKLLLQQQPVARDLRAISAALKMVTDMERIGNQAADIAEIVYTANIFASDESLYVRDMALATIKMVTDSVGAFVSKDSGAADAVIAYDDVVDGCYDKVKRRLTALFTEEATNGLARDEAAAASRGEYAIDLMIIAKHFERIGDHAANIAKWVLFSITGEI